MRLPLAALSDNDEAYRNKFVLDFMMLPFVLDPWQYRLTTHKTEGACAVGSMWLEVEPGLEKVQILDQAGKDIGVLLGFPIDLQNRVLLEERWQAPFALGSDPDEFIRKVIDLLGGRFLLIVDIAGVQRIYPDCSAQVPCIFDPQAKCIGSTAHALLSDEDYEARFDRPLFNKLGIDKEGWFPSGLTAHRGIQRLLPDHYLDLESWQVQRFWYGPVGETPDPDTIVEQIIDIVQAQLEALVKGSKKVAMGLTAGHETRMLLACARSYLDDVDFMTVTGGGRHETDTVIAQRIAKDIGLSHLILPRVSATKDQRDLFVRRGGHCNADSNSTYHPSVWPIAKTHTMVGGLGGEVGRAFFWRADDTPDTSITVATLMARFGLPHTPQLTEALENWLADVVNSDAFTVLDLAYLEHRNGAWYAPQFCSDPTLIRQAPLLTTRTVALMFRLPPEWKRENRLGAAIIAKLWPELNQYPYNSLGKFKDFSLKLQRAISNPNLIAKKIRKMRG